MKHDPRTLTDSNRAAATHLRQLLSNAKCSHCNGTGGYFASHIVHGDKWYRCPHCRGSGRASLTDAARTLFGARPVSSRSLSRWAREILPIPLWLQKMLDNPHM